MSELIVFRKLPTVCVTSLRASLSQPLVMVTVSDAPLLAKAPSTFCALLTPSVANASTLLPDGVSFSLNSPTLFSALFDGVAPPSLSSSSGKLVGPSTPASLPERTANTFSLSTSSLYDPVFLGPSELTFLAKAPKMTGCCPSSPSKKNPKTVSPPTILELLPMLD